MRRKIKFDKAGRMKYHPSYHPNQNKRFSQDEIDYIVEHYYSLGPEVVGLDLGRTVTSIMRKSEFLRKDGILKRPKKLRKHERIYTRNN